MDSETQDHLGRFSLLARAHHRVDGAGALYVDWSAMRHRYIPGRELDDELRQRISEEKDPSSTAFVALAQRDHELTIVAVPIPKVLPLRSFDRVGLVTFTREPIHPITQLSVDRFDYPSEFVEWSVSSESWNAAVDAVDATVIVHIYNGDSYPESTIATAVRTLEDHECCGALSVFVYDPAADSTHVSFEDSLPIHAMKEGTLAYTKRFWDHRPMDPADLSLFFKDREASCAVLDALDAPCCVAEGVGYLPRCLHVLDDERRAAIARKKS